MLPITSVRQMFSYRHVINPPCLVHLLPQRMCLYLGSCNNAKSESLEVHASCRQIAPKYRPCDVRLLMTEKKKKKNTLH